MSDRSPRWGWALLSLGLLAVILTWLTESFALLCWGWTLFALGAARVALAYPIGFTQSFLLGAALLNAAAGVCNGLVMTANGLRMPVEPIHHWDKVPSYFDGPSARDSRFCRMVLGTDDVVLPSAGTTTHFDVPRPHVIDRHRIVRHPTPPRLAFLDDRHGIRVCGASMAYSKGDALGFVGTVLLGIPGVILLVAGFLLRKVFRQKPSTGT